MGPENAGTVFYFREFLGRVWQDFLHGQGATSRGFVAPMTISLLSSAITAVLLFKIRGVNAVLAHWKQSAVIVFASAVIAVVIWYTPQLAWSMIVTASSLERENARLQTALQDRKDNLRAGDVAFDNMLGVIKASLLLRRSLGDDAGCEIKITAPDENNPVASVVAQLASTASRCAVIGPDFLKLVSPEMEQQATKGMLADAVLLHMPRGFKNEIAIEDAMRSILRVKRVYEVPPGSPPNTIWLQFGTGKQWNSQS